MDGSILIVDDVATNRIVLKAKLGAARYRPLVAASGGEALAVARSEMPDLILLDLMLPDLHGLDVLAALRAGPMTRDIPVIVLSSTTNAEDRLAALAAGADDFFAKPCDDGLLMARVRNLLRGRQGAEGLAPGRTEALFGLAEESAGFSPPGLIGIVSDRREVAMHLRRDLAPLMRDRLVIMSRADALSGAGPDQASVDLYLVDWTEAALDEAHRLLSDLRSRPATRHAGICLLSAAPADGRAAAMAFDLDASDIIGPGTRADEVASRLRAILRRKYRADRRRETVQDGLRLALIDPLTGLHNRRYGMARLTAMVRQHLEDGRPLAILIADLDRFKSVNDRYGHAGGDQVLIDVGRRLSQHLRQEDLLVRFGGEEFLIALPGCGLEQANATAERLRAVLQGTPVALDQGPAVAITSSFGLSVMTRDNPPVEVEPIEEMVRTLIEEADIALLSAKAAGRNVVTVARRSVA